MFACRQKMMRFRNPLLRFTGLQSAISNKAHKQFAINASCIRMYSTTPTRPTVKVLFGSQTGTAENFARIIGRTAKKNGFTAKVVDLQDYEPSNLPNEKDAVVIVASCYGEGEPTDNAKQFYDWLMSQPDTAKLDSLAFTVFGLGSSQTHRERYNVIGKYMDAKLEALGAKRIFARGEGDDSADIEDDFNQWHKAFWTSMQESFPATDSAKQNVTVETPESAAVDRMFVMKYDDSLTPYELKFDPTKETDIKNPFPAKVIENYELSRSERSCRHIVVELDNKHIQYNTGDHIGLLPQNSAKLVQRVAETYQLSEAELERVLYLENTPDHPDEKNPLPGPVTLRNALTHYVDLNTPAQRTFLEMCAAVTSHPGEKLALRKLIDDKALYMQRVVEAHRRPVDIVRELPGLRKHMPLDLFLELSPKLQPRYYSVASASNRSPDKLRMIIRVLDWMTKSPASPICHQSCAVTHTDELHRIEGVCSHYIAKRKPGDTLNIWIRKSRFVPPEDTTVPIIMLGAGSGLAPFIGFVEHREYQMKQEGKKLGPAYLYTGFRNENEFIMSDYLEKMKTENVITNYRVAYSHTQNPELVSDQTFTDAETLWKLINEQGALVYVCGGSAGFGPDIFECFKRIVMKVENLPSLDAARERMMQVMNEGRYLEDLAD